MFGNLEPETLLVCLKLHIESDHIIEFYSMFAFLESGGRSINENKALTSRKNRFQPHMKFETCKICKQKVHQAGSHYCQCKILLFFSRLGQSNSSRINPKFPPLFFR